jgi:hypothetical protein
MHYMVFVGRRGVSQIVWRAEENPLGIYEGNTPEEACQAASAHSGVMGAFYAIEGTFWGVMPGREPQPFGTAVSAADRQANQIERLIETAGKMLGAGKDHDAEGSTEEE